MWAYAEGLRVLTALLLASPGASLPRFLSALKIIFSAQLFSLGFQMSKLRLGDIGHTEAL